MPGSPSAIRLILPAALTYASISVGDMFSTSAMLSKPWLESSGGRRVAGSTSSASRSRTELAYSNRLSRCRAGLPGLGFTAAAESSADSRVAATALSAAVPGRRAPAGGIRPARSLRIIFSASSASFSA